MSSFSKVVESLDTNYCIQDLLSEINQHKYYIEHDTESGDAGERLGKTLI